MIRFRLLAAAISLSSWESHSLDQHPNNTLQVRVVALRPYNQTDDISDKDTADVAGDVFFYLADRVILPYICARDKHSFLCNGGQVKLVNPTDVYTTQVLEVDGTFGGCPSGDVQCSAYADCNPYVLKNGSLGWWCGCQDFLGAVDTGPCNVTGLLDVETRYCGRVRDGKCTITADYGHSIWNHWKSYISLQTKGLWYSTPKEGNCAAHGACAWRLVSTLKTINASCANDRLHEAIEGKAASMSHPSCFQRCSQPLNRTSDCYILCLVQTVIGRDPFNLTSVQTPMTSDELASPLDKAITFEDPSRGGCPALPPYVPPASRLATFRRPVGGNGLPERLQPSVIV